MVGRPSHRETKYYYDLKQLCNKRQSRHRAKVGGNGEWGDLSLGPCVAKLNLPIPKFPPIGLQNNQSCRLFSLVKAPSQPREHGVASSA